MHWKDSTQTIEDNPAPYPNCEICGCQVPLWQMKKIHYNTDQCHIVRDRRCQRETLNRCFKSRKVNIKVNLYPLESTPTFHYLGCTTVYNNRNWADLYQNLRKAQMCWGMMLGVPAKAGMTVQVRAVLYNSVVQLVLIYGSKIWFVTDVMMKVL